MQIKKTITNILNCFTRNIGDKIFKTTNQKCKRQLKISNKVGITGEQLAKMFLVKQNYKILYTNYLEKCGEIDIIAKKTNTLFFFEVKTVSRETKSLKNNAFSPENRVNSKKLAKIHKTIEMFMCRQTQLHFENIEVGIISVSDIYSKKPEIKILWEY